MSENISLDLYKVFIAVYECGSFSSAARRLYVTQPAVSQSIKQLESALKVSLFTRDKKKVLPTAEAEHLYGMVNPAIDMINVAQDNIEKMRHMTSGSLSISAGDAVLKYYLLPCLKAFREKYPNINIVVTNKTSTEACELLKSGKIDVAFVNTPICDDALTYRACMRIHDVFIAGDSFSYLKGETIMGEELSALPLMMLERLANSRRAVDAEFLKRGIVLSPQLELGTHDLLVDFAKINFGVSCVTREFVDYSDNSLFELQLDEPLPEREIALCWAKNFNMSIAKQCFIDMMSEFVKA
ncbi:MAG: LysR family transcriptional regulator [Clostridia bacterium]|nr:LysR family transcriptional regulator [Clostridia bacterium]